MEDIIEITKDYLKKYRIGDVLHEESVILFILESPHTQEMKYGYPVAGSSGLDMTRFIYDRDSNDAFGKIVSQPGKYETKYDDLKKFGILNVSPAPMQVGGLKAYDLTSSEQDIVEILEKLRVNYKTKKHNNQDWNQVKKTVLNDFKERLVSTLKEYPRIKYIVPCGKLAETYLNLISDEEIIAGKRIISSIPHPSFNQWSRYDTMDKLREILVELGISGQE